MSNTLTAVMPKILARGLLALREQAVMPRLINTDFSMEAAEKGDTIDIPLPSALSATDVTPSNTPVAASDSEPSKVSVQMSNWKKVAFHLADKELAEIDYNRNFVPMQMSEAVGALASAVNDSVQSLYTGIYGFVGATDAQAFAAGITPVTDARKVLNKQKAPRANRRIVLDFDTEANALGQAALSDFEKTGEAGAKIEGELGRKFGFDWYSDDGVKTHTTGAAGATIEVDGAAQVGTTLVADGFSTKPNVGDVFTIEGDDETTYTVLAATDLQTTESTLTISPAITSAPADGADLTFKGDHIVNLAFHRDAFAFASRPLVDVTADFSLGNEMMTMQDPQTGLVMRLEISRQYKRTVWELDMLWGTALVRPELGVRIASQV